MPPRRRRSKPAAPQVYRPATSHNVLVLVATCIFLALAAGCAWNGSTTRYLAIPLGLIGLFLALVGTARFRTRIVVREDGLDRSPWFPMGFALRWEEVEHWNVRRIAAPRWDHPPHVAAHFNLAGGRRPIQVSEEDVTQPGFDSFLKDIRRFIGGRER